MSVIDAATIEDRLERAREQVRCERRRLTDEHEAFTAFATRVRNLDISQPTATPQVTVLEYQTEDNTHTLLRDAYEETVMAVPHFEVEYDETYAESIRAEFGPDIVSLLLGSFPLGERHRRVLLEAVNTAIEQRQQLRTALETEANSLETTTDLEPIAQELAEIETADFGALSASVLDAHLARLEVLERKCTHRIDERQSVLVDQRRSLTLAIHDPDIPTYLYQDMSVQYPVVASTTDLLDSIERLQTALQRQLDLSW